MTWLAIAIGAAGGASSRYALQRWIDGLVATQFPLGTVAVNLTGCLAIGVIATLIDERGLFTREIRLLLLVGFLGSYTTFSTFAFEGYSLLRAHENPLVALQIVLSVVGGLLAVWLGAVLARLA